MARAAKLPGRLYRSLVVGEYVRGQKLGRDLVHVAEEWACEKGCTEMASDTWLENEASIQAHI